MDCGIKNLSVMLFELDVLKLKPLISRTNKFTHLAAYPENEYDISTVNVEPYYIVSPYWFLFFSELSKNVLNNSI